jgi:hypothetical protein
MVLQAVRAVRTAKSERMRVMRVSPVAKGNDFPSLMTLCNRARRKDAAAAYYVAQTPNRRSDPMQSLPYIFVSLMGGLCLAAFLTSAVI